MTADVSLFFVFFIIQDLNIEINVSGLIIVFFKFKTAYQI